MKRKILAMAIAAIAAVICTLGLTACGGGNEGGGIPEPTALEKAYANYRVTQNMTVTVTDSRNVKHGTDYSASVKIDYGHKTAYAKNFFTTTDNLGVTHKFAYEHYYEITDKPGFNIYDIYYDIDATDGTSTWNVIDRSDLFNLPTANTDRQKFEVQLFTDFVNSYLPSHALPDTSWRESENSGNNWASLNSPALLNKFTESANGYTADVYFCINPGSGAYVPYACTLTIKLDAQDRFKSVVVDFGANGKITAEYAYGSTTVTVPEEAKNAK